MLVVYDRPIFDEFGTLHRIHDEGVHQHIVKDREEQRNYAVNVDVVVDGHERLNRANGGQNAYETDAPSPALTDRLHST